MLQASAIIAAADIGRRYRNILVFFFYALYRGAHVNTVDRHASRKESIQVTISHTRTLVDYLFSVSYSTTYSSDITSDRNVRASKS